MQQQTNTEATESNFIIRTFPVGPLQCNCSVIGDRLSGRALVVDPGGDADKILELLKQLNLSVVAIIHTHAHLDHILAAGEIKQATGAPIYLHRDDKFLWDMLGVHLMQLRPRRCPHQHRRLRHLTL